MHGFNKKTIFFQSNRKDILTSAMQSKRHVRHDMICAIILLICRHLQEPGIWIRFRNRYKPPNPT